MVVKRSSRSRKPVQSAPAVQPQPPVLVKVTMIGPLGMEEQLIAAAKEVYASTGVRVRFSMEEVPEMPAVAAQQATPANGARPQPWGRSVADQRPSRRVPTANYGRNAVVYQVANRTAVQAIPSNSTRGAVASFILSRGSHFPSAREIAEGTGIRLKPVEGAIHALRTDGVIQSIQAS